MHTPRLPGGLPTPRAVLELEWRGLVGAIARGDHDAMARLFDQTERIVFALVLRIVGDRESAEEVLLDVFLQVWKRAATFDVSRGRVSTWLLTIARSRAIDHRRAHLARRRLEETWSDEIQDNVVDARCGCDPSRTRELEDRCKTLRCAMLSLPLPQRRAIELAFRGELSHTEIAERLAEPLGTIKTRIRLGLSKLKEQLEREEVFP